MSAYRRSGHSAKRVILELPHDAADFLELVRSDAPTRLHFCEPDEKVPWQRDAVKLFLTTLAHTPFELAFPSF